MKENVLEQEEEITPLAEVMLNADDPISNYNVLHMYY